MKETQLKHSGEEIDGRLVEVFRIVFPALAIESDEDIEDIVRDSFSTWDSIAHLMLLTCLEEEFHLTIPNEISPSIDSFAAARELLVLQGVAAL